MHDRVWLAKGGQEVGVYLQQKAPTAVRTAAENFRLDLNMTCGCRAFLTEKANSAVFLIGILGEDAVIDALAGDTVKDLRDERGELRWESYLVKLLGDGRVVLAGQGRRGAIFAVYELSRLFGVSPWYFFADVPVRKTEALFLPRGFLKTDWPSVQYRGIFLNDEEELNAWAKLHTKDGTIGPVTYRHVFELILRLKGNYIWPAMHVNAFNADPENGRLADAMGIVVGTSYCDMLLRSNQHEYDPWVGGKGYQGLLYDYSIAENRPRLQEYWRESVEQNSSYEVSYTIGMRGIHDTGFITRAIDSDPSLSEEEKLSARVRLLETVISDQREIIRSALELKSPDEALQVFIPYKEVLPLYDAGLRLPDDVIVMWTNDNFGHIRRYPDEKEQTRRGGHALYFHSSYWSPAPLSYLFINSIPLAQTGQNFAKRTKTASARSGWITSAR